MNDRRRYSLPCSGIPRDLAESYTVSVQLLSGRQARRPERPDAGWRYDPTTAWSPGRSLLTTTFWSWTGANRRGQARGQYVSTSGRPTASGRERDRASARRFPTADGDRVGQCLKGPVRRARRRHRPASPRSAAIRQDALSVAGFRRPIAPDTMALAARGRAQRWRGRARDGRSALAVGRRRSRASDGALRLPRPRGAGVRRYWQSRLQRHPADASALWAHLA
jgi:hypothetical protein